MKTAQAKNEFLAKMSHDIRTPLNGIMGMNYIASTKLPPECPEVADCLKKVDIAARYLLGILNDILDMSKIESGGLRLSTEPFSLEALKDEIEPLVHSQMEGKRFRFIIDAPEIPEYDYIGDELRLKQILINLLSNAVKFTEAGSVTLMIRVRPVSEKTDEVTFSVRDTGKGMAKEFMDHIFSPFTQENENIASNYGGSGLGLSIAKSFVELMGGAIAVTSEPGKGSEFTVTLLLEKTERKKPEAAEIPKAETVYSFAGKRLLLCEDNELNAEIAEVILGTFDLAEFVADILRKEADADVALVLARQLNYGEAENFFEGDITDTELKFVSLDYVSDKNPAYNQPVTVNLTGEQILSIMNYPYLNNEAFDTRTAWVNCDNPSYWMPSNLKIEYAPLLPENSIISVRNMDGSEFDLDKTYKVAIWNGCFSNLAQKDYFDEATLAAMEAVTPVSQKTSIELIKAAVMEAGETAPSDDGRFTIRWNITDTAEDKK